MKPKKCPITADRVRELFEYDPKTGIFVRKIGVKGLGTRAGSIAGSKTKFGYLRVMVDGFGVFCHRLAWLHFYGYMPDEEIDHRDRDRSNNSIENLRVASDTDNAANRSPRNPESGFKGVYRQKNRWRARIEKDGTTYNIGYFLTPEAAHAAYNETARKLFGEFAVAA